MITSGDTDRNEKKKHHHTETLKDTSHDYDLNKSDIYYDSLFMNNHAIMLIIDPPTGDIIDANLAAGRFYGYSLDILKKLRVYDLNILPKKEIDAEMKKAKESNKHKFHFKHRLANGQIKDVEILSGPVKINNKNRLYSIIQDVTENNRVQKDNERFLEAISEAYEGIAITDEQERIIYVNSAYADLYGYEKSELIGKSWTEIYSPEFIEIVSQNIRYFRSNNKGYGFFHGESCISRKDGSEFPAEIRATGRFDKNGNYLGHISFIRDITVRRKMEEELKSAKEKAEEMNRLKSYFLSNMNHELRTPMTSILGFSEMLLSELNDDEQADKARAIFDSGKRLMETLNLILCFSKIESNRAEMHLNNIDIIDNIRQSVNAFKPAAQNKNLYLEFLSEQEPVIARLDETMFTRIMNNLLGNAIKFTHTGGVKVKAEIEDKKINPLVHILITDTGIGIESELQEVIFEPFRQASNGFSRKFEGTGLGLSITKRYVDLLNGTITLESEQGKGSCFRVSFPLEHISAVIPKGEIPVPAQVSSKVYKKTGNILPKVLLVEDDQINQIVIKISIKDFCTTEIADNGETALQMVRENNYDIILMDINLSGELNGLETAALIKQLPGYSNVPVVAVTAYAAADEKDSILNNGCDYFLAKPFTRVEITGLIKKILADKNDE